MIGTPGLERCTLGRKREIVECCGPKRVVGQNEKFVMLSRTEKRGVAEREFSVVGKRVYTRGRWIGRGIKIFSERKHREVEGLLYAQDIFLFLHCSSSCSFIVNRKLQTETFTLKLSFLHFYHTVPFFLF